MGKRKNRHTTDRFGHYAPRYWVSWLAVGVTWLLARLPQSAQRGLTRGLTRLAVKTRSSRTKTIRRNIELCFPDLTVEKQELLLHKNMYSTILMLFDLVNFIWASRSSVLDRGRIIGKQYLLDALADDKPLIVVTGHSTSFMLGIVKLSEITAYSALYRRMDNPVLQEQLYERAMKKYPIDAIHRKEVPLMLSKLSNKGVAVILPDQDFGPKHSSFIPFFGIDTATITSIPQYAKSADANVLLASTYREENGNYVVDIEPVLENYPTGDDLADTVLWSDWLESRVREHPEDYFWLHKRFKTRPEGQKKLY